MGKLVLDDLCNMCFVSGFIFLRDHDHHGRRMKEGDADVVWCIPIRVVLFGAKWIWYFYCWNNSRGKCLNFLYAFWYEKYTCFSYWETKILIYYYCYVVIILYARMLIL